MTGAVQPADWTPVRPSGFTRLVGPILVRHDGALPRFGFRVEDKHDNTEDRAHGGMVMAFCDEALGLTAKAVLPEARMLTISFECQFIDAAKMGDFVEVDAEVVRSTRSLVFMRGTCHAAGRIIATCSGVWKIVHARPALPEAAA